MAYNLRRKNVPSSADHSDKTENLGNDSSEQSEPNKEDILFEESHNRDHEGSANLEIDDEDIENATQNVSSLVSHAHRERLFVDKPTRCKLCPRRKDRKTRQLCPSCQRPICDEHRDVLCLDCGLENNATRNVTSLELQAHRERLFVDKQTRCKLCPRSKDRKTRQLCPSCQRPICDEHRVALCLNCRVENTKQNVYSLESCAQESWCKLSPQSKDQKTIQLCPSCQEPICNEHEDALCLNCGLENNATHNVSILESFPQERLFVNKQTRCRLCPRSKDRKTRQLCPSCQRPICDEHRVALCLDCGVDNATYNVHILESLAQERLFVDKRTRCKLCPRSKDRKTRQLCSSCQRPICDEHRIALCLDCGAVE